MLEGKTGLFFSQLLKIRTMVMNHSSVTFCASTRFVLALNIISCDGAVAVEAHGPAESYGPIFNLADLHLWRIWRF